MFIGVITIYHFHPLIKQSLCYKQVCPNVARGQIWLSLQILVALRLRVELGWPDVSYHAGLHSFYHSNPHRTHWGCVPHIVLSVVPTLFYSRNSERPLDSSMLLLCPSLTFLHSRYWQGIAQRFDWAVFDWPIIRLCGLQRNSQWNSDNFWGEDILCMCFLTSMIRWYHCGSQMCIIQSNFQTEIWRELLIRHFSPHDLSLRHRSKLPGSV